MRVYTAPRFHFQTRQNTILETLSLLREKMVIVGSGGRDQHQTFGLGWSLLPESSKENARQDTWQDKEILHNT